MGDMGSSEIRRGADAGGRAGASAVMASTRLVVQTAEVNPLFGSLLDDPAKRLGWAIVGLDIAVGQVILLQRRRHSRTPVLCRAIRRRPNARQALRVEQLYSYDDSTTLQTIRDRLRFMLRLACTRIHYSIAEAGKHVLCEKPMASTSAEAEAMIAAAEAAQRKLAVAYRVHFEPNNVHVLDRVGKGDLGTMRFVSADHGFSANADYPPHKWRLEKSLAGGGSLWDIGVYGINTSLMMLPGDRVTSVSAAYATPDGDPRFTEVEAIDYRLRMASGIGVQGHPPTVTIPMFPVNATSAAMPASRYILPPLITTTRYASRAVASRPASIAPEFLKSNCGTGRWVYPRIRGN